MNQPSEEPDLLWGDLFGDGGFGRGALRRRRLHEDNFHARRHPHSSISASPFYAPLQLERCCEPIASFPGPRVHVPKERGRLGRL